MSENLEPESNIDWNQTSKAILYELKKNSFWTPEVIKLVKIT